MTDHILGPVNADDLAVAFDWAESHGQLTYPAQPGERVLIYTPTFIVHGLVARVGPLCCELIEASVVFETGAYATAMRREFKDAQVWDAPIRVPWGAVIMAKLMPTKVATP